MLSWSLPCSLALSVLIDARHVLIRAHAIQERGCRLSSRRLVTLQLYSSVATERSVRAHFASQLYIFFVGGPTKIFGWSAGSEQFFSRYLHVPDPKSKTKHSAWATPPDLDRMPRQFWTLESYAHDLVTMHTRDSKKSAESRVAEHGPRPRSERGYRPKKIVSSKILFDAWCR